MILAEIDSPESDFRMVVPTCLSTVTPGKFATFWFNPVSALNTVDFPLFGFPTNAILIFFCTDWIDFEIDFTGHAVGWF